MILPGSTSLDPEHLYLPVFQERVKEPYGVGPAADAGHSEVGQPPFLLQNLRPSLSSDHTLQLAHKPGIRVRADSRSEHVVCGLRVRYPVA